MSKLADLFKYKNASQTVSTGSGSVVAQPGSAKDSLELDPNDTMFDSVFTMPNNNNLQERQGHWQEVES